MSRFNLKLKPSLAVVFLLLLLTVLLISKQAPSLVAPAQAEKPVCGPLVNNNTGSCNTGQAGGTTCDQGTCSWTCRDDYTINCSSQQSLCGNGTINYNEECDGSNLNGRRCSDFPYTGGTLGCDSNCKFVLTACTNEGFCGDGFLDKDNEDCDGSLLDGKSCTSFKDANNQPLYNGGTLSCSNCRFNFDQCLSNNCGNNTLNLGEDCDGTNLNNATCYSFRNEGYLSSSPDRLKCNTATCKYDKSACLKSVCGNGVIEGPQGEVCDKGGVNGAKAKFNATCQSLGFSGGSLICSDDCRVNDTTSCTRPVCGNGVIESGEQCDGSLLNGKRCRDLRSSEMPPINYRGGQLACNATTCQYDTTACLAGTCGNGIIEKFCSANQMLSCVRDLDCQFQSAGTCSKGDECEGANLDGKDCSTFGFTGGNLNCNVDCQISTSECTGANAFCGNRRIDTGRGEQCDGTDLAGQTCASKGCGRGNLACLPGCDGFDTSACDDPSCTQIASCTKLEDGLPTGSSGTKTCGGCGSWHKNFIPDTPSAPGLCAYDEDQTASSPLVSLELLSGLGTATRMSQTQWDAINNETEKASYRITKYTWTCGTDQCYAYPTPKCQTLKAPCSDCPGCDPAHPENCSLPYSSKAYCYGDRHVWPTFSNFFNATVWMWTPDPAKPNLRIYPWCASGLMATGDIQNDPRPYPDECKDETRYGNVAPGWDTDYNAGWACVSNQPDLDKVYKNCSASCQSACQAPMKADCCNNCPALSQSTDANGAMIVWVRDDNGETNPDPNNSINEGYQADYCSASWGQDSSCGSAEGREVIEAGDDPTDTSKYKIFTIADKPEAELCNPGEDLYLVPGSIKLSDWGGIIDVAWQCIWKKQLPNYGAGTTERLGKVANCKFYAINADQADPNNYNGVCGNDVRTKFPTMPNPSRPGAKLCARGRATAVNYNSSTYTWSWQCLGLGTGQNINCSVKSVVACGPAAGNGYNTEAELRTAGPCTLGKLADNQISRISFDSSDDDASNTGYVWRCVDNSVPSNKNVYVTCTASKCGPAHGQSYFNFNLRQEALCLQGGAPEPPQPMSSYDQSDKGNVYKWFCNYGAYGTAKYCRAYELACGTANGQGFSDEEFISKRQINSLLSSSFLCLGGDDKSSEVITSADGSNFTWSCRSKDNVNVNCQAIRYGCGPFSKEILTWSTVDTLYKSKDYSKFCTGAMDVSNLNNRGHYVIDWTCSKQLADRSIELACQAKDMRCGPAGTGKTYTQGKMNQIVDNSASSLCSYYDATPNGSYENYYPDYSPANMYRWNYRRYAWQCSDNYNGVARCSAEIADCGPCSDTTLSFTGSNDFSNYGCLDLTRASLCNGGNQRLWVQGLTGQDAINALRKQVVPVLRGKYRDGEYFPSTDSFDWSCQDDSDPANLVSCSAEAKSTD